MTSDGSRIVFGEEPWRVDVTITRLSPEDR